jgi:uncharacterized LabA/DUF88 family protein
MITRILGIDLAYANHKAQDFGFPYFPCRAVRDLVAGDSDQVLDTIVALHRPPPRSDDPEEVARAAQQHVRTTHGLEEAGCRVLIAPAKRSGNGAEGIGGIKRSDDQVLMIELAIICMKVRPMFLTLCAADGDYAPLVAGLRREGIRTEIIADHDSLASDLRRVAYAVIDLRELLADPSIRPAAAGLAA